MVLDKLAWCIARLGNDTYWWVESLSDNVHWEPEGTSLIDPKQSEYLWDLLLPLREYGFQEEIFEQAFFKLRIEAELPNERIRLIAAETNWLDSEEKLFLLPYISSDFEERYTELVNHLMQIRVQWLNTILDVEEAIDLDTIETHFRDKEQERDAKGHIIHVFEAIIAILEYVPESCHVNADDLMPNEEDSNEDEISEFGDDIFKEELQEDVHHLDNIE